MCATAFSSSSSTTIWAAYGVRHADGTGLFDSGAPVTGQVGPRITVPLIPDGGAGVVPAMPTSAQPATTKQATRAMKMVSAESRCRMSRRIMLLRVEFGGGDVLGLLGDARQNPQEIGQSVDVGEQPLADRLDECQRDNPAFRPA